MDSGTVHPEVGGVGPADANYKIFKVAQRAAQSNNSVTSRHFYTVYKKRLGL